MKKRYSGKAARPHVAARLFQSGRIGVFGLLAVALSLSGGLAYALNRAEDDSVLPERPVGIASAQAVPMAPTAEPDSAKPAGDAKKPKAAAPAAAAKPAPAPAPSAAHAKAAAKAAPVPRVAPSGRVAPAISVAGLYVNPSSPAAAQAAAWRATRPADAATMDRLAARQIAEWYGDWTPNPAGAVNAYVAQATATGRLPLLVAYNIPQRDCGSYSAGGAVSAAAYANWIQSFANGIGKRKAIVVLEPDAVAGMDCLDGNGQAARLGMITDAVNRLTATTSASIYIDAGNSGWVSAGTMAARLRQANITGATGFALNVSNFKSTSSNIAYGTSLSGALGGKHFVIDTSRNGAGDNGEWCNPAGRAVGSSPTRSTGNGLVDAYLWIKRVGESDGSCNGGPAAGQWWAEYALGLGRRGGL